MKPHDMHHTIHKLVHQAVLRVNKPRDEIAKLISREIEKPIHQLTKSNCKKLESAMDTVIDEAKDTKFMHTEPTKDPAFEKAAHHALKVADEIDKGEKEPKAPKKAADEEEKSAPAKKAAPAKKEEEEKKTTKKEEKKEEAKKKPAAKKEEHKKKGKKGGKHDK